MFSHCFTHIVIVEDLLVYSSVFFFAKSVVAVVCFVVCFEAPEFLLLVSRDVQSGFVPVCYNFHTLRLGLVDQVQLLCDPTEIPRLVVAFVTINVIQDLENVSDGKGLNTNLPTTR